MMESQVDRELLEKIADLIGKPVGAFNIRKDCGCDGRQSTEHIKIDNRTDGKSGIDIRILDGTVGETCHIPVIITKPGVQETVYNDFYIGENCNVEIVAGCGIHNCGEQDSRHDGVHTFRIGKNSHVHYSEKHYAEGDGKGGKIMNPQTIVYLEEGASIDGCTHTQTFFRIVFPLLKPIISTMVIMNAMAFWNDFLLPSLVLTDKKLLTLPLSTYSFYGTYSADYGTIMAGLLLCVIPILILYVALQKQIINGVVAGAVK